MKVTYQLQALKIGKLEGTSRITIGSTLHDAMDEDDEEARQMANSQCPVDNENNKNQEGIRD